MASLDVTGARMKAALGMVLTAYSPPGHGTTHHHLRQRAQLLGSWPALAAALEELLSAVSADADAVVEALESGELAPVREICPGSGTRTILGAVLPSIAPHSDPGVERTGQAICPDCGTRQHALIHTGTQSWVYAHHVRTTHAEPS